MAVTDSFNILVFSKTAGYRHASIPTGITSLKRLADETGFFTVTASEDASFFTSSILSRYRVLVLLHTSGDFLTDDQLSTLQEYVRSGGGVLAIHGSAAGMPSSSWYAKLIGAHFDMHPDPEPGSFLPIPQSVSSHPIIAGHEPPKEWMDEWYNFKSHPSDNESLQILLRGDTKSFRGGKHGDDHPLAWYQEFDGGRSVYLALGHFDNAYADSWFMGTMERMLMWAAGRGEANNN
ncbi:uncharacterized protein EKO05_0009468 [Ascochyta rabiei]|uniref:Hydrolase n=1 Tax=Didymella rabiei TaxID=5454 RepID=A0A163GR27_DIDRA|nr:uncharacterized protein EKO05_0009468 [Ascochyta rabiei]KZM24971.1 hydrolase [Ascochyta rabiei]UPX19199.1 hypothetical protein EKO05_0009468 [Ascochyta rabiei]